MSDHEGHHRRSLQELLRSLRKAHWIRALGDDHSNRRASLDAHGGSGGAAGGADFRSRSRSLDDNPRGSVAAALARGRAALVRSRLRHEEQQKIGEVEATYRVYESILREGEEDCNFSMKELQKYYHCFFINADIDKYLYG